MGSNVEEALRAKALAEKHFLEKDYVGANNYALRAQRLCPEMEGISQMVATFAVYIASEAKINDELDFYSILGLDPSAEKSKLKKHYKKMAVLLHPDKNKTVGADEAFRLVSEAWSLLSDNKKRSSYDHRRNQFGYTVGSAYDNYPKFPVSHVRSDTFWTVCTSCHVQYEYLRKYVNKRLSCKNCRGVFIAHETGLAAGNGSFPYTTYSYGPENTYGSHGRGVTYVAPTPGFRTPNGASGHRTGHRSEYGSNISFQSNPTGTSTGVVDPNGLSSSSFVFYQANGDTNKTKQDGESNKVKASGDKVLNGYTSQSDPSKPKRGRPSKKRKVDVVTPVVNGPESSQNIVVEAKRTNVNGTLQAASKLSSPAETSSRRWSAAPQFDARHFLLNTARKEISTKLSDMKLAAEAKEAEKKKAFGNIEKLGETVMKKSTATGAGNPAELKRSVSMSITVPDSDFHDFDQDRSEECFKPKQIWALYDEEDGMPRLYCLVRELISVNPFKIYISYLNSKSDAEFGSVNWLDSGFTKSCGSFRVFHSEMVEQVNIFSHLLSREKAGRGGCVRIYPRKGDIWAVYRNWSPDWNRTTPDEVRHRYEMVEVIEDYSEEKGVWVTPLVKLDGFKTVYQRNANSSAVQWIPKREMLRFSHQVPSCSLKVEGTNLPDGCWDLDPAATPDELLQPENEIQNSASLVKAQEATNAPEEQRQPELKAESEEQLGQSETFRSPPSPAIEARSSEGGPPCLDVDLNMEKTPMEIHEGGSDGETVGVAPSFTLKPCTKGVQPCLDVDLNMVRSAVELPGGGIEGETFRSAPPFTIQPCLGVDLNMERTPMELSGGSQSEMFSSPPFFTNKACTEGRSCFEVDLNMERPPIELQPETFASSPSFNVKACTTGRTSMEVDLDLERVPVEFPPEFHHAEQMYDFKWS